MEELMCVKRIRNLFAHRVHVRSFNTTEVKRECRKLLSPYRTQWGNRLAEAEDHVPAARNNRARFLHAMVVLFLRLELIAKSGRRPKNLTRVAGSFSQSDFRSWLETHGPQHLLRIQSRD